MAQSINRKLMKVRADLSPAEYERAGRELDKIEETYGERDFLKSEIVRYLRTIGRYVDVGADGSE